MRHAQLVEAVGFGEVCHQADLVRRGVARNTARRLEADDNRLVARLLVRGSVLVRPHREVRIAAVIAFGKARLEAGICEERGNALQFRSRRLQPQRQDMRELFLHLPAVFVRADLVNEDLDPRLVLVVAAAVAVVDAKAGLGVAHHLQRGHEIADHRRDHRGAAHAAADVEARADFACVVLHDLDADIMQPHRRAVGIAGDHRDLELARQVIEFRMEARPLAQQLGIRARIDQLVRRRSGKVIRADVADAVAARLDRMHLDRGEVRQDLRRIFQLDPVVLDVLARGEVAIAAVVLVRDVTQHPHLAPVQRAIGDRHAQHIGVELEIEPVLQPQRLELVLGDLARHAPRHLPAEFLHARIDHGLIILVILVHVQITCFAASGSPGRRERSSRTVGPSARMRSLICAGRTPSAVCVAAIA